MKSTPIHELRKPHPNQARIDAAAAALLRVTAAPYRTSIEANEAGFPNALMHRRIDRPQKPSHDTTTE